MLEEEIKLFDNLKKYSAILIYGLRRVGKTSLIKETIKKTPQKL